MAKSTKKLEKKNWRSRFSVVGRLQINEESFDLDKISESGNWKYNRCNFGINCGPKFGTVYVSSSVVNGGFNPNRDNTIRVYDKDSFGDYTEVAWEDRNDPELIKNAAPFNIYTFAMNGVNHRFLSLYDMIKYASEHLEDGMTVMVTGDIRYNPFKDSVTVFREVRNIYVADYEEDKFRATFEQTMLVDRDSVNKDQVDKEKGIVYVDGYMLEKFREYNGHDLTEGGEIPGGQLVPIKKRFEYLFDTEEDFKKVSKKIKKLFKPEKGVTQLTVEGIFKSGGAVVTPTLEDLDDDIRELVEDGIMTMDDVMKDCAGNSSGERRMIIIRPKIRILKQDDGSTKMQPMIFEREYDDEDFDLYYMTPKEEDDNSFIDIPLDDDDLLDGIDLDDI